ncbi:hypothetical protein AB0M02_39460 [Actinoplanes sp. NPDC051861]|uniref:hypothetical protein n=1 Tax=Actinoplanes sp. NPDC051861 TaxID=3155170 RepID=UPI003417CBDE
MARIAPTRLVGRDAELGELALFCSGDDTYGWWRAPAWAGKSALAATFAMNPPPGVRIASFFITARYAGQNDRVAFADVLIREFAEILGVPVPDLTDATRDVVLLDLMDRAAAGCRARGQRLVLLVDGLDEDRGVTTGPGAYSIAALLPPKPADGMRVIVTGRPNPPIPDDVPDDHPLRDPAVVRALDPSPEAAAVGEAMRRELGYLLDGSSIERELLGFITAAGGGLSAGDLSELTGVEERLVRRHLNTVAGRSFTPRPSTWRPGSEPDVYVLGHEELQVSAMEGIGAPSLARYRRGLSEWASGYRSRGWPTATPEYLLRGYFRLLQVMGDVPGMVECATDPVRHDRMLDITGGDLAATAEITAAMDAVMASDEPDLLAMIHLAMQRDRINERNSRTPRALPAVWEALGRRVRADTVAHSIADTRHRCAALMKMASVARRMGDGERAQALVDEAAALAEGETRDHLRKWALEVVAGSSVAESPADGSSTSADPVAEHRQVWARTRAPELVASGGDYADAEALARAAGDPHREVAALIRVGRIALNAGDEHRAAALARTAATVARASGDHRALGEAAAFLGESGRPGPAESLVRLIQNAHHQDWAMFRLIRAVAESGDTRCAERMTGGLGQPYLLAWALIEIAAVADADRLRLLDAAAAAARRVTQPASREWLRKRSEAARATPPKPVRVPFVRAHAMKQLVESVARTGDRAQVSELSRRSAVLATAMSNLVGQAGLLTELAGLDADHGDPDQAAQLAERAGTVARTYIDPWKQARLWIAVHAAVTRTRQFGMCARLADRAESWIGRLSERDRDTLLTRLTTAVVDSGDIARATAMLDRLRDQYSIDELRRRLADPSLRDHAAAEVARACVDAGEYRKARAAIDGFKDLDRRDRSLLTLAHLAAGAGAFEEAKSAFAAVSSAAQRGVAEWDLIRWALADGDFDRARTWSDFTGRPEVLNSELRDMAVAAAKSGDLGSANAAIVHLDNGERRNAAWSAVAMVIAERGNHGEALAVADRIESEPHRDLAVAALARSVAKEGDQRAAARYIEAITSDVVRDFTLTDLATHAAEAGDERQADAWARSLSSGYVRDRVGATLAEIAEDAGNRERADRLLDAIQSSDERSNAVTSVIAVAACSGDHVRAHDLARRLDEEPPEVPALFAAMAGDYEVLESMQRPSRRDWLGGQVARIAAWRGDYRTARSFARTDPVSRSAIETAILRVAASRDDVHVIDGNGGWTAMALGTVLEECLKQGRHAMAEALCSAAGQPEPRATWTGRLAVARATDNDPVRAAELIETLPAVRRDVVRQEAAVAAAGAGCAETAEDLVRLIENNPDRHAALARIAALADDVGDHAGAEDWIGLIDSEGRAAALVDLAAAAFQRGDRDRACVLVAAMPGERDRQRAWSVLSGAAAGAGDLTQALAFCDRIADLDARAGALRGLAYRSDVADADKRRLLGWSLRWGPWDAALPVAASLEPDVVVRFAEQALASDAPL